MKSASENKHLLSERSPDFRHVCWWYNVTQISTKASHKYCWCCFVVVMIQEYNKWHKIFSIHAPMIYRHGAVGSLENLLLVAEVARHRQVFHIWWLGDALEYCAMNLLNMPIHLTCTKSSDFKRNKMEMMPNQTSSPRVTMVHTDIFFAFLCRSLIK